MNYGTVMSYEYEEEIEINGEPKTVTKTLDLVFNAMTLIKYLNYTGRDFLDDFLKIQAKSLKVAKTINSELINKVANGETINFEDISENDLEVLTSTHTTDTTFFVNLIAAMIATKKHNEEPDFISLINEIPFGLLYDQAFMTKLLEFVMFGLKKNKQVFNRLQQKR